MDNRTLCELLECSVCLESFNEYNNKVLPCQHTFCRFCLDNIVFVEKRLVCPECRLSVDTKVDDLPSNVLLNRILSTLKNPQSHDPKRQKEKRRKKGLSSLVDYGMKELNMPCVKALYGYKALENGDLSFKKDDVIELLYQLDENWFVGRLDGKQGFMPSNYVQVLCPLPTGHICRAKHNFSIQNDDKNCLSFKKDDLINVIRMVDDNWLEGSLDQRVGIFPEAFVELDGTSRLLLLQNKLASNIVDHFSTSQSQVENFVKSGSMRSTNESLMMTSSCDLIGSSESRTSSQITSNSYPNLTDASKSSTVFSSETEVTTSGKAQLRKESPTVGPIFDGEGILPLYQATLDYCPKSPDELDLKIGKMYVALKDKGGGWLLGKSVAKGTVGLFPMSHMKFLKNWNYLEKSAPQVNHRSASSMEEGLTSMNKNVDKSSTIQANQSNSCEDLSSFNHVQNVKSVDRANCDMMWKKRRSANVGSLFPEETMSLSFSLNPFEHMRTTLNHDHQQAHLGSYNQSFTSQASGSCHHRKNPEVVDVCPNGFSQTPQRSHFRLSSIAYGVSSLIHRNMVKQKMMNKRCMSASTSRCK